MLIAALAATAAVTLAVIGLGLGAYSGGLPGPMQRIAHDAIGAPAAGTEQSMSASPIPVPSGTPSGRPGGGRPPGHGGATDTLSQLCASYQSTHGRGGGVGRSTAFHELITAAGGAGKVPGFCARVLHPGPPPPGAPSPHAPPPPRPPHKKKPHPDANGNGNSQGDGGGSFQGNGHGQPPGGGNGGGQPAGGGNGNGSSQGNGNANAQGPGVPDASWAHALAP
jgi:hypothetical protein